MLRPRLAGGYPGLAPVRPSCARVVRRRRRPRLGPWRKAYWRYAGSMRPARTSARAAGAAAAPVNAAAPADTAAPGDSAALGGTAARDETSAPAGVAPARGERIRATRRSRSGAVARVAELCRFGSVGLVAFVVDAGLFNLLRFGPGGVLAAHPLTAQVVSVAVAVLVAWLGNRYWTFASTRSTGSAGAHGAELARFVVANLVGMGIAVGCLAVSHYLLGFTSPLADNIAANGVGLVLGTLFRYLAYRHWVFTGTAVGTSRGQER